MKDLVRERSASHQPSRARVAFGDPVALANLEHAVAAEALEWLGTPFKWGQSVKGEGCDCKGLIAGVARELGRTEGDSFYGLLRTYRVDRPVPAKTLLEGFEQLFDRVFLAGAPSQSNLALAELAPGRLLLLNYGGRPAHMAIYVGNDRAVHAYPSVRSKVIERDLAVLFHRHPLHSIWRWRA
jgi:cell wall-associated NlpC family hydrolase